jgi:hypothetical protein
LIRVEDVVPSSVMVTIAHRNPPEPDPERKPGGDPLVDKLLSVYPEAGMTPPELRAAIEEEGYATKEEEALAGLLRLWGRAGQKRNESVDQSAAPEVDRELLRAYLLGTLSPEEDKAVAVLTRTYTAWNHACLAMFKEVRDQIPELRDLIPPE